MAQKLVGERPYDWNTHKEVKLRRAPLLNDETLRDGLQWPFAKNPTQEQKIELLRLMNIFGIHWADLGLPMAGKQHYDHIDAMITAISSERMEIKPTCAVRTVVKDIEPIHELQQKHGMPIRADMFLGISPPRLAVEGWSMDNLLKMTEEAVRWARERNIPVMYVTEDTTRAEPEVIKRIYRLAIDLGAEQICICDTVGHASPEGAKNLVGFVIDEVVKPSGQNILVHWHGHRDRGLGLWNAFAALETGADVIHGTALGIGERTGNVPMELILVNLKLMGLIDIDLTRLSEYVSKAHDYTGAPLPTNYPIFGETAFATATGVHASAIIKAGAQGGAWWADTVYSGVPASLVGRKQAILVGPMSGRSNVIYWLKEQGYQVTETAINRILGAAKDSNQILTNEQLHALAREN